MGIKLAPAKSGNIGDVRIVQLTQRIGGNEPAPYSLTQVDTVEAYVRCNKQPVGTLAAAVTDAANGIIEVQLGGPSGWLRTAKPGVWSIEYKLFFNDGSTLTWPDEDYDTIEVTASIG